MVYENLPKLVGFSDEHIAEYERLKKIIGDRLDPIAKRYVFSDKPIGDFLPEVHSFKSDELSEYALNLLFVFECSGYLWEKYKEKGISKEVFINSLCDCRYKVKECYTVCGEWGAVPIDWFNGFFKMWRFSYGRLTYDSDALFDGGNYKIGDYTVLNGDFVLGCHIPSDSPLYEDAVIDSLKRAYNVHKDSLRDGILRVRTATWLIYPPYQGAVIKEGSNINKFYNMFHIYDVYECGEDNPFPHGWRIFGTKIYDVDKYKTDTSLRRNFISYIKNGGTHGVGRGLLLFDGEKVIKGKLEKI